MLKQHHFPAASLQTWATPEKFTSILRTGVFGEFGEFGVFGVFGEFGV